MTARHLAFVLGILATSSGFAVDTVREVRFAGTLSSSTSNSEERILRNFEAVILQGTSPFFCVLDDEQNGCPWPESFGRLNSTNGTKPRLIFEYDGSTYTLPLPAMLVSLPNDINTDSRWTADGWSFEVDGSETIDGIKAWKLHARERRGRKQSLSVAAATGLLLKADLDVFMGQGEKFDLSIRQTSNVVLDEETALRLNQLQTSLVDLQSALNRRPDTQLAHLSPRQLSLTSEKLDKLTELAKQTPLQESVLRIRQDIDAQSRRVSETSKRQQQLMDKPAPRFALSLISGGTLESESLNGKVTVIHFWNYAEKPLSEPYGQVGYLEFLYNKRKSLGLEVVGVAMNSSLQQSDQVTAGRRTARKLVEFMNLTYPIGYDDGSLLRAFGDPRTSGGTLPLWIVVSKSGTVAHYHTGFYEIDRQHGLKELDELLMRLTGPETK